MIIILNRKIIKKILKIIFIIWLGLWKSTKFGFVPDCFVRSDRFI